MPVFGEFSRRRRKGGVEEVVENIFVNWEETLKKWFARDEKHQRGRNQPIGTRVDTIKIETECMTNLKKIRQEIYSGTTS